MTAQVVKTTDFSAFDPDQKRLFDLFARMGIAHDTWVHPPIFTVEEGVRLNLPSLIPGRHGKSLFLTTDKGELWLVVAWEETRINLKDLSVRLGTRRFSFARPDTMMAVLGVSPGSVTPFALMNDVEKRVTLVLDAVVAHADACVYHPLRNNASTVVSGADLVRFVRHVGYDPRILEFS